MSITVPNDILEATTKCPYSFSCIQSGKCGEYNMCNVSYPIEPYVLALKSKEPENCAYRINFGSNQFCSCPTHFTIYQMQKQKESSLSE
jgi:hypothetical protein